VGRLNDHIEKIYKEIGTTIARMGQMQKEVDELKARLQRFVSGHAISN
jgi:chaperonin cofactor prefoldin